MGLCVRCDDRSVRGIAQAEYVGAPQRTISASKPSVVPEGTQLTTRSGNSNANGTYPSRPIGAIRTRRTDASSPSGLAMSAPSGAIASVSIDGSASSSSGGFRT